MTDTDRYLIEESRMIVRGATAKLASRRHLEALLRALDAKGKFDDPRFTASVDGGLDEKQIREGLNGTSDRS